MRSAAAASSGIRRLASAIPILDSAGLRNGREVLAAASAWRTGEPTQRFDWHSRDSRRRGPAAGSSSVAEYELLAHYESVDEESGDARSGFAMLVELSESWLMMESDVGLEAGCELSINFFLPDRDEGRTRVAMQCVVLQCRDHERLHYSARISKIDQASRLGIEKLCRDLRSGVTIG